MLTSSVGIYPSPISPFQDYKHLSLDTYILAVKALVIVLKTNLHHVESASALADQRMMLIRSLVMPRVFVSPASRIPIALQWNVFDRCPSEGGPFSSRTLLFSLLISRRCISLYDIYRDRVNGNGSRENNMQSWK